MFSTALEHKIGDLVDCVYEDMAQAVAASGQSFSYQHVATYVCDYLHSNNNAEFFALPQTERRTQVENICKKYM